MMRTAVLSGGVVLWFVSPAFAGGHLVHTASSAEVAMIGPAAEDWFGSAVDVRGDVVIAGAPVSDGLSPTKPGRAFVYSVDGQLLHTLTGEANGDKFGAAVAVVGDLTGDGFSETLVGAPGYDSTEVGSDAGRAYLYSGKTGALIQTFTGNAGGDWFGFSAAGVGDVNADGVPDFAIGARQPEGLGYVRIYCGATLDVIHTLSGEQTATHFGFVVSGHPAAGSGDVNGDGFDDVIVGAPFHPAAGFFGGRAYVFSGNDGSLLHTFTAEAGFNFFGTAVAIAGDVNGDGHADVLIGADGNSAGGTNAGRAYVYSGKDGSLLHVFTGGEVRGRLGRGVSAIGDVNGDGRADLLVGQPAPLIAGGSGIGRAFIMSGATGALLHEFVAEEVGDFFGFAVAGDDGEQVIVGAFASDAGGTQSGAAYVFDIGANACAPADLNCDGIVNVFDLLELLAAWGTCAALCAADLNNDELVNVFDLLELLATWGGRAGESACTTPAAASRSPFPIRPVSMLAGASMPI